MGSAIANDSRASARSPVALTNTRTGLAADAIALALIENLRCLQAFRDGWQVEMTNKWLRFGNPWEIVRSEIAFDVKFGGRTETYADEQGRGACGGFRRRGQGHRMTRPVSGYRAPTTHLLRLWKAKATETESGCSYCTVSRSRSFV
jgi:hypothetical protein